MTMPPEPLQTQLKAARAHWLNSKESALGQAKEYASKALLEAVGKGGFAVSLDYKKVSTCLSELKQWAASNGCELSVSSDPREPEMYVTLTWRTP